ncbi:hypothetical protein CC86DRAFT_454536 [Ophiobolus disseminans]|uniref:NACHT-NTPase and P-loop NTPases N-terminal domain-containing protein n=1 Tax=Ophiobolus disseminans TaxID=1469910 RepID=A0A6A7A7X3_9PLEO|nr:hypothetical protein CC86DRAFT_454536 [Ophiobolus disseminans]
MSPSLPPTNLEAGIPAASSSRRTNASGLSAIIVSIIHITTQVTNRLNDLKKTIDGIPRSLQGISSELPTYRLVLKRIQEAEETGRIPEDSREVLKPLLKDMKEHFVAMSEIVDKMRPKNSRYDDKIKYHESVIRGYFSTLSLERLVSGPGNDRAASSQASLVPTSNCPFGQNPDFIERPVLAAAMAQNGPGSRRALVGGAGMGKSQLAISYGHRVRQASPNTWVFWVDTKTAAKFEQGYRDIADLVRIVGRKDRDANILSLVYEWLRNTRNGRWVMILDNADDVAVLTHRPSSRQPSQPNKQLCDFLPQSLNGSILATSRSSAAANLVIGNDKHIIAVEPMTEAEAMALLRSRLEEIYEDTELKSLLKLTGCIPLAVAQAADYMGRRSLLISEYIQELQKGNKPAASPLSESSPQPRRDQGPSNSLVAGWKGTREKLRTRFSKEKTAKK